MNYNLPPMPPYAPEFKPRWATDPGGYNASQMQAYARAAIERQSVPKPQPIGIFREDDDIGHVELCPHQQAKLQDGDKLFAAAPQPQPVQEQCPECDGTGTVAGSQAHFPCPLCTSPQEAQPLTKAQRAKVCVKAEAAMQRDQNLSWRDALINETEQAHGITKGTT